MESIGKIVAAIGAIGFIISMWMLFGYLYFKKGSVKKGFLLLFISLALVGVGVIMGIQGSWNNFEKGLALPESFIEIIENVGVEDATQQQNADVAGSVYLNINEEDWEKYSDEIEKHYIALQKN